MNRWYQFVLMLCVCSLIVGGQEESTARQRTTTEQRGRTTTEQGTGEQVSKGRTDQRSKTTPEGPAPRSRTTAEPQAEEDAEKAKKNIIDLERAQKRTSRMLDLILDKDVDYRIRPNVSGPPVEIEVSFMVASFGSIDEVNMDYSIMINFRQAWTDPRLVFPNDNVDMVTVPPQDISQVWTPDLFFSNEKTATLHDVTQPNKVMWIYNNGSVSYSTRLSLKLDCPMDLTHFPLDKQKCDLIIESYRFTTSEVTLKWKDSRVGGAVELDKKMELPQFDLFRVKFFRECVKNYQTGTFPCLRCSFWIRRKFGFFLLQTYVPTILIVILSWVSFWINMEAVPARISLGVTTVLTMTTQLSGSKGSIPRVSYPKAIDVWMAVCMVFVFAALVEYAFVNSLSRKHKKEKDEDKDLTPNEDIEKAIDENTANDDSKLKNLPAVVSIRKKLVVYRHMYKKREVARLMDKVSRLLFPLMFLIFNLFYWPYYIHADDEAYQF